MGSVLCNACGLFLKLHGRPRPISLKTDVIKSRNRVKAANPGQRKKSGYELNGTPQTTNTFSNHLHPYPPPRNSIAGVSDPSISPVSRCGTPGLSQHVPNIAPQHLFDAVTFDTSGMLPFQIRHPSPTSAINACLDPPPPYDTLLATSNALKTRVSELEVINDLFRGRVAELEASEQEARRAEAAARESERRLRKQMEELHSHQPTLTKKRSLEETLDRNDVNGKETGSLLAKKMRVTDVIGENRPCTPFSARAQSVS